MFFPQKSVYLCMRSPKIKSTVVSLGSKWKFCCFSRTRTEREQKISRIPRTRTEQERKNICVLSSLFPTLISKIRWLRSGLFLNILSLLWQKLLNNPNHEWIDCSIINTLIIMCEFRPFFIVVLSVLAMDIVLTQLNKKIIGT